VTWDGILLTLPEDGNVEIRVWKLGGVLSAQTRLHHQSIHSSIYNVNATMWAMGAKGDSVVDGEKYWREL